MNYLIGDLQGCCNALQNLLQHIDFSPSRDHVYFLGDLVNRGPDSLRTLRQLQALEHAATCVLGNHDLHCLAVAYGTRTAKRGDTLDELMGAPDRAALIDWLRQQHLAVWAHGWLMVHAGVVPQWQLCDVLQLASDVQQVLRGPQLVDFLRTMYSNEPSAWHPQLATEARLRFTVNALTRIRFCTPEGALDMHHKDGASSSPDGLCRWFEAPARLTQNTPIAFGHWSTLGLLNQPTLLCLDTGCVWGGRLSAARLSEVGIEIMQIDCEQAQKPL
jgi:bis(5'-nucleosyl)-tetraphosphatase (symmetrical)